MQLCLLSYEFVGTFLSGVSLTCCSRPQHENIDCSSLVLVNVWVALFQLISSVLFLIGYVWSLVWGFSFITISSTFYINSSLCLIRKRNLTLSILSAYSRDSYQYFVGLMRTIENMHVLSFYSSDSNTNPFPVSLKVLVSVRFIVQISLRYFC